jgi:hypothetical protein
VRLTTGVVKGLMAIAVMAWSLGASAYAGQPRGAELPAGVRMPFRAGPKYFEVQQADGSYKPFYMKGMNMSVAIPGHHPSEFPYDEKLYLGWLDQVADMNVNTVRLYTILPPEFYRALLAHNKAHPTRQLWLLHGIWAEAPPNRNYLDQGYMDALEKEMRDAINVVHGKAVIAPAYGHAEGGYTADVSPWLVGWLVGREWEPDDITGFQEIHPEFTSYSGQRVSAYDVQPIESWLARICDYTVFYEEQNYSVQHPVTFSSWPPADPLSHVSESNIESESELASDTGETRVDIFSNDSVNLSAKHFTAENLFPAGIYASYHVYTYYPDFLDNDPQYQNTMDRFGRSNYAGYLSELKGYYDDRPLLVAEYGLPNGPVPAHQQAQGWNHGGLSEAEVAAHMPRLTLAIHDSGCAGGIVFAWIDEWFKKVWMWVDMYDPYDEIRLWYNPLDAEENYGMLALRPTLAGTQDLATTLTGNESEWSRATKLPGASVAFTDPAALTNAPPVEVESVAVSHDNGFVNVKVALRNFGDWDFKNHAVYVGFDVLDPARGNFAWPGPLNLQSDTGLETVIEITSGKARLLQTKSFRFWEPYRVPYSLRPRIAEAKPYRLLAEDNSYAWVEPTVETNIRRIGRDGSVFEARSWDINPLYRGTLKRGSPDYDDRAMWNTSASSQIVELRVPWILLGFVGPQQKRVLQADSEGKNSSEASDGIRIGVVLGDGAGRAVAAWPGVTAAAKPVVTLASSTPYVWDNWDIEGCHYRTEIKPVYYSMQKVYAEILDP